MKINLADIENKEFSVTLRGYNKKEVKEFLEGLVKIFQELLEENRQFSEKILSLQKKINDHQSKKSQLDNLITSAQKEADRIIKQSQEKANFIIKETLVETKQIQEKERKKLENIKIEIEKLSNKKKLFLKKFKDLLRSQQDLLKFYEEEEISSQNSGSPLSFSIFDSVKKVIFEED